MSINKKVNEEQIDKLIKEKMYENRYDEVVEICK